MQVQKVENISYKDFMNEFYKPGIPVVFKDASKVWKARGLFTPKYFRDNFSERKTVVNEKEYTMGELLDLIENSSSERPAPYPCKFDIPSKLPELLPLITPLGMNYAVPNWFQSMMFPSVVIGSQTELFLGSPGGKFPVAHIDYFHTNAWVTQLYGDKNFIVYPRGQDEFMYPKANNKWESDVNIFNPDYEKHPKYKNATPITVTIKEGETIFVPWGIWHSAESLTPSISVIFDQINASNYDEYVKDVWKYKKDGNKAKALAVLAYCKMAKYFCKAGDLFARPQ
ncbi:MAG TPA: cupin-like domain-containing protein [Puia sp.]|nr:cupin-like domain-containing protein [Puia sp.]